jgi:hypothetical protein
LDGGEELSVEERERALTLGEDEAPADGGQTAHDEKAVKTLREKAIAEMSARGITISASENTQALALFPKVYHLFMTLGLAHAVFCRWLALRRRFTTVVP